MRVIETAAEMQAARECLTRPVGFVPTMGALHDGHATLVRRARAESAAVVTSLFVNPAQFGPDEDYAGYPRDRDRDLAIFEESGADVVFTPSVDEMYPPGGATIVDPGPLGEILEGRYRPGHFRGVATVVSKLFAIVRPDRAYFGEKDAQQLRIIRALDRDLRFGIEIVGVPTVRAADGLALSSRNVYLNAEERRQASAIFRSLKAAQDKWAAGERKAASLRTVVYAVIGTAPLLRPEYVSVADGESLAEVDSVVGPALVSLAVQVGKARLIDNMTLPPGLSPAGTGRG